MIYYSCVKSVLQIICLKTFAHNESELIMRSFYFLPNSNTIKVLVQKKEQGFNSTIQLKDKKQNKTGSVVAAMCHTLDLREEEESR